MAEYSPSAIVVDYRRTGFKGVAGSEAIAAGREVRLAEMLGDEFIRCRRGDVGMFWNPETQSLELDTGIPIERAPAHIMTTTVQRLG